MNGPNVYSQTSHALDVNPVWYTGKCWRPVRVQLLEHRAWRHATTRIMRQYNVATTRIDRW